MTQSETTTVRLKVSSQVARIVGSGAPRDAQMSAARGALPLGGKDLLTVLFFLCNSKDAEIKKAAVKTLRVLPESILDPLLKDASLHPQLIEVVARTRIADTELMGAVIVHPKVRIETLLFLARKGNQVILERLAGHQNMLMQHPEIVAAIIENPFAERTLKFKLGWLDPEGQAATEENVDETSAEAETDEGAQDDEDQLLMEDEEKDFEGMSKYQIAMELKVAEKIKMGLTGDKEWRTILIKESNKLIQGAVMKNPRITDGEVLTVAKSKTSSDEIIRIILLNRDWLKLYEIKKALVVHPKTPPAKAMRFVSSLSLKDLKVLARSRQISRMVATAVRKELDFRIKKQGG